MTAEAPGLTKDSTVFEIWQNIFAVHPEVTKFSAIEFLVHPHGQSTIPEIRVLPREEIDWGNRDTNQFWGRVGDTTTTTAIGARVEVRPKDYESGLDYSQTGRYLNNGELLEIKHDREKSFILLDFESRPGQELISLTTAALSRTKENWYLLDSGNSYHLIIDKLVSPLQLIESYGQFIVAVSEQLPPVKGNFYKLIGQYLLDNSCDCRKLNLWINEVLKNFGHLGEPVSSGKLVFPIDMRWVAHVINAIIFDDINDSYLRVSRKHGSVPVLIAMQENGQKTIFASESEVFNHQPMLTDFKF